MPEPDGLEPIHILGDPLMDDWPTKPMNSGYDHVPKAFRDDRGDLSVVQVEPEVEVEPADADAMLELQRQALVNMIAEVVKNAEIVGQEGDATVYLMHLGVVGAAVLAALRIAMMEDG